MSRNLLSISGVVLLIATAPLHGGGQDSARVEVRSAKPLKDMCVQLEQRLNLRITYEDAPVIASGQLVDEQTSTGATRRSLRPASMSLDIPAALAHSTDQAARREAFDGIVRTYNATAGNSVFKAIHAGGGLIHVVPTAVRDSSGALQPFEPMLDTRVTIPSRSYSLGELVAEILAQVSSRRGIPIVQATVPVNLFAQARVTEEALDEPARDVLVRAFEEINGPRLAMHNSYLSLTWYLLYNADGGNYFFNVHAVSDERDHNSVVSTQRTKSQSTSGSPYFENK